ncbi:MAG: zeta toxin family protein [Anaerolineae bacterium]|nr:zeta toxin family protein [Anaerolineae bacterium]
MSDEKPVFWLIAGPNGSGKSTFYEKHLSQIVPVHVNPDRIAKQVDAPDQKARDFEAMRLAEEQRQDLIAGGKTFAAETVFSHPSKIELLRQAQASGYDVNLVFICTDNPYINSARVQQRVQMGGHSVPPEKIAPRYERSLQNLREALPLVDRAFFYDNSINGQPHRLVLEVEHGKAKDTREQLPQWVEETFPEGVQDYLQDQLRSQEPTLQR